MDMNASTKESGEALESEDNGEIEGDEEVFDDIYAYIRNAYDPPGNPSNQSIPPINSIESIKRWTFHIPSYYLLFYLALTLYIFDVFFFSRSEPFLFLLCPSGLKCDSVAG